MSISNIHDALEGEERAKQAVDRAFARAFVRIVRNMNRAIERLEIIGENDMGIFWEPVAKRYHDAVRELRDLANDLTQDADWPHEPGVYR